MQRWFNNFSTSLSSPLEMADTVMQLSAYPALDNGDFCYLTISQAVNAAVVHEIVKLTRNDSEYVIARGQDGTSPTAFSTGAIVENRWIAADAHEIFAQLDDIDGGDLQ